MFTAQQRVLKQAQSVEKAYRANLDEVQKRKAIVIVLLSRFVHLEVSETNKSVLLLSSLLQESKMH